MNTFLVGNGFDLHHKFPTRYIDFLHIVQFLVEHYDDSMTTVGHILGDERLHAKNTFIHECYEKHNHIYQSTSLSYESVDSVVKRVQNNLWFKYLGTCVSKNIKWIDFEKEIIRVLEAFSSFFHSEGFSLSEGRVIFDAHGHPSDKEDRHILSQFSFFFDPFEQPEMIHLRTTQQRRIKPEYVSERIVGSNSYHLVTDDIVSTLYMSLRELADVLRDYLKLFVDAPSREYANLGWLPHFGNLPTPNRVFSFNYTYTFETLYHNNMIDHIHGNTHENIVLGMNPDDDDQCGNIDTTFLQFKKYFQRVFFQTDIDFLRQMSARKATPRVAGSKLYVIGHSLDSTDEDVIKQIFASAESIIILYHNESSVKNQIKNLVEIYGKEGLDDLREKKKLQFLPQPEINWYSAE